MRKRLFSLSVLGLMLWMIPVLVGSSYGWSSEVKFAKKRGYLGVSVKRLTSTIKKQLGIKAGVVVVWVKEDSPADNAGIIEDDIIIEVGGKKIRSPETLTRVIRKIKPDTEVNIVLVREGKKQTVKTKIGKARRGYSYSWRGFDEPFIKIRTGVYMGATIHELNNDLAEYFGVKPDEGVLILEVDEDSPASDAGLKAGDVMITMNDEKLSEPDDVWDILSDLEGGDEVVIKVIRHNDKKSFTLTLEEKENEECNIFLKKMPGRKRFEINLDKKLNEHLYKLNDKLKDLNNKIKKKVHRIFNTI